MKLNLKNSLATGLTAIALVALTACGGDKDEGDKPKPTPSASATVEGTETPDADATTPAPDQETPSAGEEPAPGATPSATPKDGSKDSNLGEFSYDPTLKYLNEKEQKVVYDAFADLEQADLNKLADAVFKAAETGEFKGFDSDLQGKLADAGASKDLMEKFMKSVVEVSQGAPSN